MNIAQGKDGQDEFHDDVYREVGVPRRRGLVDDSPGLMVGVTEHDLELSVEVEGVFERSPAGGLPVDVDVGSRRLRFDVQDALSAALQEQEHESRYEAGDPPVHTAGL